MTETICRKCGNGFCIKYSNGTIERNCKLSSNIQTSCVSECDGFSAKPKEKLSVEQKVKNRIVLAEGKLPRKGSQRTEAYKLSRMKVMKYMGKVPKV